MRDLLNTLIEWGPSGMFIAALLDGAGVPVPGGVDALIIFLASQRPQDTLWLALVAVLGSVAGNLVLFSLARRGGQLYLEKKTHGQRTKRFRAWFDKYGLLTVFISALVPLPIMPMKIFVLCAGALGSSPAAFLTTFLGARIPRYVGLAYLGRAMGNNAIEYLREHAVHLLVFAVLLFLVLYLLVKIMDRRATRLQRTA
jgi:membrane protein DedA with SNARE-associated domain